jgi:hypothetical protein
MGRVCLLSEDTRMGKAVPAYQKSDSVTHAAQGIDALRRSLFLNAAGYTHPIFNYAYLLIRKPAVKCSLHPIAGLLGCFLLSSAIKEISRKQYTCRRVL